MAEIKIIAHRGASVEAPENTMSAFKKAIEIGVSCIECDVHVTKDEVAIISHDETIPYDHTQSTKVKISSLLYSEVMRYDVGEWFAATYQQERVPTLTQLLELDRGETAIMLELKKGDHPNEVLVEKVIESLKKCEAKNVYVGSFDAEIVTLLQKKKCPGIVQGLAVTIDDFYAFFSPLPKHVVMDCDHITKKVVDRLHLEGREVWTYTVDSPKKAKRLVGYGVDGIITNDPQALKEVFFK